MAKSSTIRKNFSISRKFQKVDDILATLPDSDQSRFICEAILHYNEFKNNPNWLLQQVAPIVQMQQQLSALYPNQGTGNVAPAASPSQLDTPTPPIQKEQPMPEKTVNQEETINKTIQEVPPKDISNTNGLKEVASTNVEQPEPEIPNDKEVKTSTQAPKSRRRISSLSKQFDT